MFEKLFQTAERLSRRLPVSRRKARLRRIRRRLRRAMDAVLFRPPKPDHVSFVIGGTQKGGTTALDTFLREHPNICMGDQKEVNFFSTDGYFKNRPNYNLYHAHYSPPRPDCILGDASPDYTFYPAAAKRIHEYDPSMKWIILLRNPIERAFSAWNMRRHRGMEPRSFHDAIQAKPTEPPKNALGRDRAETPLYTDYIARGLYAEQLQRIHSFFSKEQVLVLKSSELLHEAQGTLDRVLDFLGVTGYTWSTLDPVHAIPYETRMDDSEWQYLRDAYEDDIKELERILGWDCSDWLKSP